MRLDTWGIFVLKFFHTYSYCKIDNYADSFIQQVLIENHLCARLFETLGLNRVNKVQSLFSWNLHSSI